MKQEENPYREHGIVPGQTYQYNRKKGIDYYVKPIVPTKEVIDVVLNKALFEHKVNTKEFIYYQLVDLEETHYCLPHTFLAYFIKAEAAPAVVIEPDPYMCDNCGGHMSYVALVLKCDKCGKREKGW